MREIVDSHHHLLQPSLFDYPWLMRNVASFGGNPSQLRTLYAPPQYRADTSPLNLRATVFVQAECLPEQAYAEAVWVTGLADASNLPTAMVAYADPSSESFVHDLDKLARSPLLRGIRMRLNFDTVSGRTIARSGTIMFEQKFRDGLKEMGVRGLSFEVSVFAVQLKDVAELASAVPGTTLIINNAGWPLATDETAFALWKKDMLMLSAHPNVFVKFAGLFAIDRTWSQEKLAPWILELLSIFGARRCMYGSNLPIEKLMCPMPKQIEVLDSLLSAQSEPDRQSIFCETAQRVYRL